MCSFTPDRLAYPGLGQCGDYLTHRPHLSMYPYRDQAAPLYPQSNPAKFAEAFRPNQPCSNGQLQGSWSYPTPSQVPSTCGCVPGVPHAH